METEDPNQQPCHVSISPNIKCQEIFISKHRTFLNRLYHSNWAQSLFTHTFYYQSCVRNSDPASTVTGGTAPSDSKAIAAAENLSSGRGRMNAWLPTPASSQRKRFRTKFKVEQKEKDAGFYWKGWGWRIQTQARVGWRGRRSHQRSSSDGHEIMFASYEGWGGDGMMKTETKHPHWYHQPDLLRGIGYTW